MALDAGLEPIEVEVNDGSREEGQGLTEDQATNDRDAEGPAHLGAGTGAQRQRESAQQSGGGRHHDRSEPEETRFVNRLDARLATLTFGLHREVDHQNRVFLDQADQQDDADQGDDAQVGIDQANRQQRANARRRQRRKNRDRVNVALIQNAQNDVNRRERRDDQQAFA